MISKRLFPLLLLLIAPLFAAIAHEHLRAEAEKVGDGLDEIIINYPLSVILLGTYNDEPKWLPVASATQWFILVLGVELLFIRRYRRAGLVFMGLLLALALFGCMLATPMALIVLAIVATPIVVVLFKRSQSLDSPLSAMESMHEAKDLQSEKEHK